MITAPLIVSLIISSIWLAYIAFYNARVQGWVFTWVLRHLGYIKDAEIKFGSISVSILGGKVMFRELKYITKDYSLRSVDGAFIFKWFTRLSPDDISRESQTWSLYHIIFQSRALLTLHGLEMHVYNRTQLYDELEKIAKKEVDVGMPEDKPVQTPTSEVSEDDGKHSDKWGLRNLIPVLVVEVQKGKFVVGNNLTESALFVDIETATAIYSTPSSKKQQLDPYMHMIKSKVNKIRITLHKSPGYKGLHETPPSQPEPVPLLRSREARIQYIQDIPGRVTSLQKSAESSPEWEMTVKFMRETVMHYGPWLDRQRDILYKFFYPYDYTVAEVSPPLKVGDLRRHQHLNVIIDFEANATLIIPFYREETTSSLSIDIANGSRILMQIPWTVTPQGFTTQLMCDLYKVECKTSMDYRPLLEAEEVHAMFQFQYPRVWHHRQVWECDFFSVSKPTLHLVFDHVAFITDLLEDWSPPAQPDLQSFIPYVWRFDFKFSDALIVLPVSQHNWVDCIQNKIENSETVFFGLHCEMLDVHFELPWTNFQPLTTELRFDFNAEEIVGSIWLPQYHTLRDSLKQFNMGKIPAWLGRADKTMEDSSVKEKGAFAHDLDGWEECWSLQDLFLRFTYLSNSVIPYKRPGFKNSLSSEEKTNHLGIEVMLGPSVIRLHGVFFRHLWFFKDNYFGYDDKCTPLAVHLYNRPPTKAQNTRVKRPCVEYPIYDLDITCKVIVKDILGEFPRHCTQQHDSAQIKLPCAQLDEIVFELWKTQHEAKMELTVSPITILFGDECRRPSLDRHLAHGFLQLQGVKVLMCGLYSGVGIDNPKNPFDFLEYGFLVEVTTGPVVGKVTVPHVQQLAHWLEIFLWQALDRENEMPTTEHQMSIERVHSSSHKTKDTVQTDGGSSALKEYHNFKMKATQQKRVKTEDLKYLMIKVSVAHTDLHLVEAGCSCNITTKTIRVGLCNAHDETTTLGVTVVIQGADVVQYVRLCHDEERYEVDQKSQWLEAGTLTLPPVMFDVNKRLNNSTLYREEQRAFLKIHDKINQCLLFLWHPDEYTGCGCVGGVTFNNTTLLELNGFYFEPLVVPPDFCHSASNSTTTPWKSGRGSSQIVTDGSHASPGSSVSSIDKKKHGLLHKDSSSRFSPRLRPSGSDTKKSPGSGKKKTKSRDSGEWFTTFPQRTGSGSSRKHRDKHKTMSHYNDLLRNFSIRKNISRLSSKRKSKDLDSTAQTGVSEQQTGVSERDQVKLQQDKEGDIDVDAELDKDASTSSPSIFVTQSDVPPVSQPDIPLDVPEVGSSLKASNESLGKESLTEDDEALLERRISNAEYTLPPQSPESGGGRSTLSRQKDGGRRPTFSRSSSRGGPGTLSRSSSQDSFHSAKSGWKTTDGASSTNEDIGNTSEQELLDPVKDLSIPFPFPKAADSALNHELVDIYRDHLPRAWLPETRFSNSVVVNRSHGELNQTADRIPHRISVSRASEEEKPPAVSPAIPQLLQIVQYILPRFETENSSDSNVTSSNLFSTGGDTVKPDPKLLELKSKWESKLKNPERKSGSLESDNSDKDGKVFLITEIADPVDLFFTPFCVHALNKYIETAELFYKNLPPAAVINLVQAAAAPTVLEIATQHATAQRALLFSNHLQPVTMKKFDNSLERTVEERLNLELFVSIPAVSIRTLQGGGDLQWLGTESELESARSKAQVPKGGEPTSTEDEGLTDRSERSDVSSDVTGDNRSSSGVGSSSVICPNKVAKLSLVKFVAKNIDVSFSYHQFERQKPAGSGGKAGSVMEEAPPGEYTQTAFNVSVDGVFGQLHILHPLSAKHSDTFIPYSKTRVIPVKHTRDNVQKLSSRETSIVFEFGGEKCRFRGGSMRRNLLVSLPELPSEQHKPRRREEEEETKLQIESFNLDEDSIDIELGEESGPVSAPFGYSKIRSRASIHYHSGPDKLSLSSSFIDEAQEPLISDDNSSSEDVLTHEGINYKRLESDKEDEEDEERDSKISGSPPDKERKYHDKSSISGEVTALWFQIATPSEEQTDTDLFNPYSSLPHAVCSWSEPGSLLVQHAAHLAALKLSRLQSVMSVLLAEALGQENQYEPPNYTTKYSRLTIASKTLKESAVIRLMNQLRYTLSSAKDMAALSRDLDLDVVPRRIVLERGIQAMLVVIEGNMLQSCDNAVDSMSHKSTLVTAPPLKDPGEPLVTDKSPVYYLGKQDYGSTAPLDRISIGKLPQTVQSDAKHRTHRHALLEMLSSSDRAKLADKYFSLYQALKLRLPRTDHVNHQLTLTVRETTVTAIDCHMEMREEANPLFRAANLSVETCLSPADRQFSVPKPQSHSHRRTESRSSTGPPGPRGLHRSESASSVYSRMSSKGGLPSRPSRRKKNKKTAAEQQVKKSVSHVVKHLIINAQIETCVTEINLDMVRLSKALVDGMSNFQPGSFQPFLGRDSTVISESMPSSPQPTGDMPQPTGEMSHPGGAGEMSHPGSAGEVPGGAGEMPGGVEQSGADATLLRPVEEQFVLTGGWERMNEYIQLMFRGEYARKNGERRTRTDKDMMLYSEAPDIPLSVTTTWHISRAEIVGRLQGLRAHVNVGSITGAAGVLQNLYVEMSNSPNSDIILEPLSPNVVSGQLSNTTVAVHFYDKDTSQDNELLCIDIPSLDTIYSFLPHVTKIQKMFINIAELKARIPKPIVEIKNVLLISTKLVLHEIKSFERYFQRPLQSLQRIQVESLGKQNDIDLNLVIRTASLDLYLLPSLSLKHEIGDLHFRFSQSKSITTQLDIHHHELSLDAAEVDLHTHLPLPQIFIRGEKVKKKDGMLRVNPTGEQYTGSVEIKTFQLHLPTTMLNHVLLVQNAFMKEINEFLDTITMIRNTVETTTVLQKSPSIHNNPHMIPFAFVMKLQGIDLLATTPSDLAMSLKTETINVEIKNRMKTEHITVAKDRQQIIERARMFISTTITTDITLGQLADLAPGEPRSSDEDMVKFLQFRATASLGNDEGLLENKVSSSESFHATISNPQLFMQPGAFDKALLFYLNYKCAYSIFNDERQKLNSEAVSATETFKNRFNLPEGPPVLPTNTHLKVTVKNLAVCLPIQRSSLPSEDLLSASQTDLLKYTEGALSISIKTAEMMMTFGATHLNKGHFNDFMIRFIDDFDEKRWTENAAPRSSEREMNSISLDLGKYYFTTVTTSPNLPAGDVEQSGKMCVSVHSDIKGVSVHLSTNIISKLVALYKTLTSIVGADDGKYDDDEPMLDETELVKNLGVQHAEKGQFNEVEAVKIWKRTALQTKEKKDGKVERQSSKKGGDEVSMFSTRTSDHVGEVEMDGASSASSSTQQALLEPPLLQFEMDLDLRLGNGKVTLYPISKSETADTFSRKGRFQRFNEGQDFLTDNTEFLIPETMCELHYTSKRVTDKGGGGGSGVTTATTSVSRVSADTSSSSGDRAVKSGELYCTVRVMALKQDQIIRPCFLEYLDQLLSRGKTGAPPQSAAEALQTFIPEEIEEILREPKKSRGGEESKTSPTPSSDHSSCGKAAPTDTFPVDIIILVLVEPSTIKLSCQPYSRHECSLVVPRSQVLLSTKGTPSQDILTAATHRKEVYVTRDGSTSCWNLTWCLGQCKLSLYHPLSALSTYQSQQGLPSRAEVRNALSVTVDGGNVHITRITTPKEVAQGPQSNKRLIAHVSSMLDIGTVSLTYDIKRMDEVDSFHNAWLSGQFIKRLLLLSRPPAETAPQDSPPVPSSPPPQTAKHISRSDRFYSMRETTVRQPQTTDVPHLKHITEDDTTTTPDTTAPTTIPDIEIDGTTTGAGTATVAGTTSGGATSTVTTKSCESSEAEIAETNLTLSVKCQEVTLTTNLGHTLGRISISVRESRNRTALCLKERHDEQRKVDVLVGGVVVESTAGLITGLVRLEDLSGIFEHCISPDESPTHSIKISLNSLENKIEYLSNCIHMLRLTGFSTQLNDKWDHADSDLRVGGSISWDKVQTMVNCNTAPNMVQIKAHLDEFILHQKKYSQRAYMKLLNLEQEERPQPHTAVPLKQYELEAQFLAHHWFWAISPHSSFDGVKVLLGSGRFRKPIRLGGTLKLSGESVSVAVFQGEKFRDDTWCLVDLNKVRMKYETLAEEMAEGRGVTRQQAVICMGDFEPDEFAGLHVRVSNNNIGSVEKCVRSSKLSPPERTDDIRKWLQYACTHDFAHGNPDRDRNTRSTIFGGGSVEFSTIFQVPESMLNLTTEHDWEGSGQESPASSRSTNVLHHLPIPIVSCRLKSHFRGAIGLATNAGNYFFLHDLAQRYTKKMEICMEANPIFAFEKKTAADSAASSAQAEAGADQEHKYGREFRCEEWELKPPLRLQGGGKVEVNVDWVLNKLGFKNPTVTIPKWIQRGPMDPLDFLISGLVKSLVFQQAEIVSEQKGNRKS